ncbi:hypothetical protein LPJ75_006920, partial [Coemansia sp. RSA 2598]
IVLIAYALVVWAKLTFGNQLMQLAWNRYRDFERRTAENKGTETDTGNLKQFDDATKKPDNNTFFEVGKLIAKEGSEAEWDKQRPKLTLDNIERYTLFKSRIPPFYNARAVHACNMSRGRGWGGGARREMNGLQTELLRDRKLRKLDSGTRATFPEYEMIPGRPLTSEEKHIASLMDEFRNELKSSVFYLKPPPTPPDVERFSDRYHAKEEGTRSLKELKTNVALFPDELQSVLLKKRVKRAKRAEDDADG